jgi:hypothetical protein
MEDVKLCGALFRLSPYVSRFESGGGAVVVPFEFEAEREIIMAALKSKAPDQPILPASVDEVDSRLWRLITALENRGELVRLRFSECRQMATDLRTLLSHLQSQEDD